MLTADRMRKLHEGVKLIESEGGDGIKTASERIGEETAIAVLMAHMRIREGAFDGGWPVDPKIDDKVNTRLREIGLLS